MDQNETEQSPNKGEKSAKYIKYVFDEIQKYKNTEKKSPKLLLVGLKQISEIIDIWYVKDKDITPLQFYFFGVQLVPVVHPDMFKLVDSWDDR